MNSRSVLAKLILGFLLVVLPSVSIMAGISFYAFQNLTIVNRQLQETNRSLLAMRGLETAVARALVPLNEVVIYNTPGQEQHFKILMGEIESRLKSCTDACHGAARQPRETTKSLLPYIHGIKDLASSIFKAGESPTGEDRFRLVHEANQHGEGANHQLKRMSLAVLLRTESLQRKSQEVDQQARTLILVSLFLVVGLALLIGYLISRRLWPYMSCP